ncbi:MAG: MFS transporter [Candidatus Cloacimonetes bacterium]|nr:MFS transporter [Candidatus Cloacimonadota bacterium]
MNLSQDQLSLLKRWRTSTFFVMLFGYIGYYMVRKNLSSALPLLETAFNYTNSDLGVIAAWATLVYSCGKFVNGPLGDKVGGRKMFLIGMAGAIVCNILFSMGDSITYFTVTWCMCSYFLSMGWGGLTKVIGAWYEPEKNGTVMGFISLNFQFGGVVATLFTGFLVAQGCTWDKLFLYPAFIVCAVWIWSFLCSRDNPGDVIPGASFGSSEDKKDSLADFGDQTPVFKIITTLLSMPVFRNLLIYSFVTTMLRAVFFVWTPKFLVDIGMGSSNAILKSALFPFLGCLGTVLLGYYTDNYVKNGDRAKAMWIMLLGLVVSLFGVAYLAPSGVQHANLIVLLVGCCGFFLLGPYSMSSGCLTLDIAGSKGAGSCTGLIDGIGYIGAAIATWGAGQLSDSLGWSQVFLILACLSIAAVFSAFMMSQHFQKIHNEQS